MNTDYCSWTDLLQSLHQTKEAEKLAIAKSLFPLAWGKIVGINQIQPNNCILPTPQKAKEHPEAAGQPSSPGLEYPCYPHPTMARN